MVAVKRAV